MKYVFFLLLVLAFGCGKNANVKTVAAEEAAFSKYVNAKDMPADPNLTLDKHIVNNQYPIELALYQDHSFFYNLPNLGNGKGTWKFEGGKLQLTTKRKILSKNITMNYEILAQDIDGTQLAIQFSDRFGEQKLKMTNTNL